MIGLKKVTGKIIADAEADARIVLAEADEKCAEIRLAYQFRTEQDKEELKDASDRECQALIVRAKSSAVMAKRNAVLEARAAIMDEAYAQAERQIRAMTGDRYLDLLAKVLRTALKDRLESEEDSLRLYGEDIAPAAYEILLSEHDRVTYGKRLMDTFRTGLGVRFPAAMLGKLILSEETAPIDGGLILRAGPVETNASLSTLLAENRRETEARVSKILFGEGD